jgi:hypothetical protein
MPADSENSWITKPMTRGFTACLRPCARAAQQQILYRITSDEKYHLKKLRAKYFILTARCIHRRACPLICSISDTLRRMYTVKKEGSAAYKAAAERASDHELADTYLALAKDEARHSKRSAV